MKITVVGVKPFKTKDGRNMATVYYVSAAKEVTGYKAGELLIFPNVLPAAPIFPEQVYNVDMEPNYKGQLEITGFDLIQEVGDKAKN